MRGKDKQRDGAPSAGFFATWVLVCAIAEFAGIAAAAGWWIVADRIDAEPATLAAKGLMIGLKSLSGAVEGLILGSLQAAVLVRRYRALPVGLWIAVTCAAAIAGWAIGSSFAVFGEPGGGGAREPSLALVLLYSCGFGLVVGAFFGGVQAIALRRAARHAIWWVGANAAGWATALPIIYAAASLTDPAWTLVEAIAAALGSGLLAGLAVGVWTGLAFRRVAPR